MNIAITVLIFICLGLIAVLICTLRLGIRFSEIHKDTQKDLAKVLASLRRTMDYNADLQMKLKEATEAAGKNNKEQEKKDNENNA